MTFLRWLTWKLLGWHYVLLTDSDGEETIRRLRKTSRTYGYFRPRSPKVEMGAWRMGLGIAWVTLNPDGTTSGACYVKKWEPLTWTISESSPSRDRANGNGSSRAARALE